MPFFGDVATIEFANGPGATVHGSGALSGYMNLVLKTGASHPGGFVTGQIGFKEDFRGVETGYGWQYDDGDVYVYAATWDASGFRPVDEWDFAGRSPRPAEQIAYSLQNARAFGFDGNNYQLSTVWNHGAFNLNAAFYQTSPRNNSYWTIGATRSAMLALRPKYVITVNEDLSLELQGSLLWQDHAFLKEAADPALIADETGAEHYYEGKLIVRSSHFAKHSIAFGGLIGERTFRGREQYFSNSGDTPWETLNAGWRNFALFLEDVYQISDAWVLTAGLRYENEILDEDMSSGIGGLQRAIQPVKRDFDDGQPAASLSLHYRPSETWSLRASFRQGFRFPDIVDYGTSSKYNMDLIAAGYDPIQIGPEQMDSWELNFHYNARTPFTLDVNLFHNTFTDYLHWHFFSETASGLQPGAVDYLNALPEQAVFKAQGMYNARDDFAVFGGELIAVFAPGGSWQLRFAYAYAEVERISRPAANADRYPKHQIKAALKLQPQDAPVSTVIEYLFNDAFPGSAGLHPVYRSTRNVVNLAINWQLNQRFTVKLSVDNLFEQRTPAVKFDADAPYHGTLGSEQRRVYLSFSGTY
jgi:outer membrane receptor for ferrienterochelin and colicin